MSTQTSSLYKHRFVHVNMSDVKLDALNILWILTCKSCKMTKTDESGRNVQVTFTQSKHM